MRHAHLHDASASTSAQGRKGLRQRPPQPGQEHDPHSLHDPPRGDGRGDGGGGLETKAFVFEAYLEGFLAPALEEGQIVVMDNLGAHKTQRVRELIEQRGCEVWFLPAYSPDLNPIEEAFSKVKALLRKATARTREELVEAMGEALSAVTSRDAAGWFAHCGYEIAAQSS